MGNSRSSGVGLAVAVLAAVTIFALMPAALGGHVVDGADKKVTNDNNNVDGGTPNPGFDAQNRQSNETSVAISPADSDIVVEGANDYRMVTVFGDAWLGFYVSDDGGSTWFNTMVPGFLSDTSSAGLASPLSGLDGAGDPVVRFDGDGNLYVGGISFNRSFQSDELPVDTVAFVAKYEYTPGTQGGVSTPNSAANPPNFTYAFTTIVGEGAVGFGIPDGQPFGFAGLFPDKNWQAVDTYSSSPCEGNVYYTFTKFTGLAGAFPIVFARSTDGGATFSAPKPVSNKGADGTNATQGSHIGVASDGTVFVSYRTFPTSSDPTVKLQVVRSDDCGLHFGNPVTAATFIPMPRQAAGLTFRTPTETWLAVDDTNPDTVYVTYMSMAGNPANADVFVARSIDGGLTWGAPAKVNDDTTKKHQFWPTIAVSNGVLHVAWYDFRKSRSPNDPAANNHKLDVFYASSNTTSAAYPAFSHNERVTDVSHDPNCLMFGGGTVGFHGDYIELASHFDGAHHIVHVAWADNRDVSPCDLDAAPGPDSNNTGNRNQNIYTDTLTVAP